MSKGKDMLGPIVRAMVGVDISHHGLLLDIANKLGGDYAGVFHASLTASLRASTADLVTTRPSQLLQPIGEPVEFISAEKFVVADEFVLGTDKAFPVSFMGDNFKRQLLPMVETLVQKVMLQQRKLLRNSVDTPILKELGGEEKARSQMAHVKQFLKAADRSNWHVFYVVDCFDVLCALRVRWLGDGWSLVVSPVSSPDEWSAGSVVVAR